MRETVYGTDDVPSTERFGHWSELMRRGFAPMLTFSEHPEEFRARQRVLELGDVQIWQVDCAPSGMTRPERLVRESDPGTCGVIITRRGLLNASAAGRDATCGPGDLYVQDTSHASGLELCAPDGGTYQAVAVMVPRDALPLTARSVNGTVGLAVPQDDALGSLLYSLVDQLTGEGAGRFRPADGPRLGVVVRDVVAALLGRLHDADAPPPPESRDQVLALRAQRFILHNLADPRLGPPYVAAAHHVSVSYLHQVFRCQGMTVNRWIRHQRLEHARRDLDDPAQRAVPVQDIAARWGFPNASDFTRAFRTAYGMPPRDYRHR